MAAQEAQRGALFVEHEPQAVSESVAFIGNLESRACALRWLRWSTGRLLRSHCTGPCAPPRQTQANGRQLVHKVLFCIRCRRLLFTAEALQCLCLGCTCACTIAACTIES